MSDARIWRCDRCGFQMIERHCKVICPNCGARWDCSDVTIWVGDSRPAFVVRPYRPSDQPQLARAWPQAPSMLDIRDAARGAWLLLESGRPCGYVVLFPLPGLPHIVELHGDVRPSACREGGATLLLNTVLQELESGSIRRLSYAVDELQDDDARFLQGHGFRLDHEEWRMQCTLPPPRPKPVLPSAYQVQTLPRGRRIDAFLRLYDQSFSGMPWYQPYSRGEVVSEWDHGHDLLFLLHEERPVGFAWLRERGEEGEIEPMGLLPNYQGRGLGRALLLFALWRFTERGLRRAVLGLWRQNEAALHLYQKAGFRQISRRYYLALQVDGRWTVED